MCVCVLHLSVVCCVKATQRVCLCDKSAGKAITAQGTPPQEPEDVARGNPSHVVCAHTHKQTHTHTHTVKRKHSLVAVTGGKIISGVFA